MPNPAALPRPDVTPRLPQPTLASREFWSSGADGILRICRCRDCETWVHPPAPICPVCRGLDLAMTPTSGTGVVASVTVNHQPWSGRHPLPYAIAIVEIDDAPGVRLTTNVIGIPADEVRISMRVAVVFERREDVWLPLFAPVEGSAPAPALRHDHLPGVRSPASSRRFEHDVAITGVGQSEVGRRLMRPPLALTVEACLAAVADAGLGLDDIDGLSTYPGDGTLGMTEGGIIAVEEALRLRPTWVNGGPDIPGQLGSVIAAMLAVSAGLCRHVLCFRTVWEASHAALLRTGQIELPEGRASGQLMEWRAPFGAAAAPNWIALQAASYAHRYGDPRPALGAIAIAAREGAARNPEAVYREPLTMADYLGARMVSTPLGLYDCDVPCDGSVAVVVSAREAAADSPYGGVLIEAVGTQILERLSWDQGTLSHLPQTRGPAAHLWSRTDLRPADVDVALLYDGFTFNALSWLEAMGFCGLGEGVEFVGDGSRIRLGGELPLNPHGGQLSAGRLHGFGFLREAVVQLRGQAGERQVTGAQVAAVTAGGGTPAGAFLLRSN